MPRETSSRAEQFAPAARSRRCCCCCPDRGRDHAEKPRILHSARRTIAIFSPKKTARIVAHAKEPASVGEVVRRRLRPIRRTVRPTPRPKKPTSAAAIELALAATRPAGAALGLLRRGLLRGGLLGSLGGGFLGDFLHGLLGGLLCHDHISLHPVLSPPARPGILRPTATSADEQQANTTGRAASHRMNSERQDRSPLRQKGVACFANDLGNQAIGSRSFFGNSTRALRTVLTGAKRHASYRPLP